ncbi:C2H2 finger domain transcription factor CON7 [Fusarium oxysporum f. sp. albedinis]|nr:C2H2 finger domain transcription factor CON7 [Fusarium oxysporum f. sp. albedinis]
MCNILTTNLVDQPPENLCPSVSLADRLSTTKAMYHFTPDLNVAKKYAAWAKRRDNVASVIIVKIAIQNSAIPISSAFLGQVRSGESSSGIAVQ